MFRKRKKIKIFLKFVIFIIIIIILFSIYNLQKELPKKMQILIIEINGKKEINIENKIKNALQENSILEIIFLRKKISNKILENIPQIEYIKISLPFKIKVEYKLYKPIAKICNTFCALLSENGIIFPGTGIFPTFYSEINFEISQKMKKEYLEVLKTLKELNIKFNALVILKNGDLRIVNDIIILIDPKENLHNQIMKLKFAKEKLKNIKYLDLRIPERIFFY